MTIPPQLADSHYAGLDRRLMAYAVDVILLYAAVLAVQFGINALSGGFIAGQLTSGYRIEAWVLLTVSMPTWLYFTLSEASPRGASLGKRWLRIRVTRAQGGEVGRLRALVRTLVKLLPWELTHLTILTPIPWFWDPQAGFRAGLVVVYALLGLYMLAMIVSPRKRGIHDLVAGTLVLRTDDPQ